MELVTVLEHFRSECTDKTFEKTNQNDMSFAGRCTVLAYSVLRQPVHFRSRSVSAATKTMRILSSHAAEAITKVALRLEGILVAFYVSSEILVIPRVSLGASCLISL